ncbi:hypothetical protein Tco_1377897 [Tanacetum coccineum]
METCDPTGTPMETKNKLDLYKNGTSVDATKYQSMIGSLMYLTASRPDIVHATCLCARYQAQPTEKHLKEVKRIFRYLRGTVNMDISYTKDSSFELTGFSDADHMRCQDSFKSGAFGEIENFQDVLKRFLKHLDCFLKGFMDSMAIPKDQPSDDSQGDIRQLRQNWVNAKSIGDHYDNSDIEDKSGPSDARHNPF